MIAIHCFERCRHVFEGTGLRDLTRLFCVDWLLKLMSAEYVLIFTFAMKDMAPYKEITPRGLRPFV